MIIDLNSDTYSAFIAQEGVVLVEFWATWCGPCRAIKPTVEKLGRAHPNLKIGRVDIDVCGGISTALGLPGVPYLLLFADGHKLGHVLGLRKLEDLEVWISTETAGRI